MGPFETEMEALAASLWAKAGPQAGNMRTANLADLAAEIGDARVAIGAHDAKIIEWLAGWEPSTVAVVAGLIHRAHESGRARSGEVTP